MAGTLERPRRQADSSWIAHTPDTAIQAERLVAWVRAAMVPVLALGETLPQPDREPAAYYSLLGAYAVFAALLLAWLVRRPSHPSLAWAATAVDVAAIAALAALSGGAFSPVRSAFFLLPVSVAFRFRPALTAGAAAGILLAYLLQAILHPSSSAPQASREIAVRGSFLALTGLAAAALSLLLERRTRRVAELSSTAAELEARYRDLVHDVPIGLFKLDARGSLVEANPALRELVGGGPAATFPAGLDAAEWRRRADAGELRGVEFDSRNGRGEPRRLRTTGRVLRDGYGRTVGYEGTLEDVSDRRRAELELEARARQQAAVAALARSSLASGDVHALMEEAADAVARTLEVEFCKVLELEPDGRSLVMRAGTGWRTGLVGRTRVSGRRSQAAFTLRAREPVISEDIRTETRFLAPRLLLEHRVRSGLSVMIGGVQGPYGVLGAHSGRPRGFSLDDARFLEAVAGVLASAIERSRADAALAAGRESFEASRRRLLADVLTAEERERQLLAEGLHDHAIQSLATARQDLHEAAAGDREALSRAEEALTETIRDLREAIFELDPRVSVQAGFEQALRATALRAARRGRFELRVAAAAEPGRHERLLLGVARQLLANAAHHAAARRVEVRVARRGDRVVLLVADDGRGFDPSQLPARVAAGHIGLVSQQERVESAGGSLRIRSGPGRGTAVLVRLPA